MVVHPASVFSSRWHGDSKCGRERPPIRATGEKSLREKDQAAGRRFLRPEKHRPNCAADGSLAVGSVRTYSQHQHNRRCPSFTFTYHDSPFYIYMLTCALAVKLPAVGKKLSAQRVPDGSEVAVSCPRRVGFWCTLMLRWYPGWEGRPGGQGMSGRWRRRRIT